MGKISFSSFKTPSSRLCCTLIFAFISSLTSYAQYQLCLIDDEDGFANVRAGRGTHHDIVGSISSDDLFYRIGPDSVDWQEVVALQWTAKDQVRGFMHKSRIRPFSDSALSEQRTRIEQVLLKHRRLVKDLLFSLEPYDRANTRWQSSADSLNHRRAREVLRNHAESRYSPILQVFANHYCLTGDVGILDLLIETMWLDKGTANELPASALAGCFHCDSETVAKIIASKDSLELDFFVDQIEFGLMGISGEATGGREKETLLELNGTLQELRSR